MRQNPALRRSAEGTHALAWALMPGDHGFGYFPHKESNPSSGGGTPQNRVRVARRIVLCSCRSAGIKNNCGAIRIVSLRRGHVRGRGNLEAVESAHPRKNVRKRCIPSCKTAISFA